MCLAALYFFMARTRNNSYRVRVGEADYRVPARWWKLNLAKGWLVAVGNSKRLATVAVDIVVRIEAGAIRLWKETGVWIYTSWIAIDRIAPPRGDQWQRDIESEYGPARFERSTATRPGLIGWNGSVPK